MNNQTASGSLAAPAFCLRLPDHQSELHQFMGQLLGDEMMTDVILSLDDGQILKAHKIILSAFSPYFRSVLTRINLPYQYPVVIIKDVQYDDLKSLLEFIYRGQVTVSNERLPSVLKCAKQLKIRGLFESPPSEDHPVENGHPVTVNEPVREELYFDKRYSQSCQLGELALRNTEANESAMVSSKPVTEPIEQKRSVIVVNDSSCREYNRQNEREQEETAEACFSRENSNGHEWSAFKSTESLHSVSSGSPQLSQQRDVLDLSNGPKRLIAIPPHQTLVVDSGASHFAANHHFLMRSISVDAASLRSNSATPEYPQRKRRASSSCDGQFLTPDCDPHRKEKRRNLNVFHAAKYRSRKRAQLDDLFNEEKHLQKQTIDNKCQIEKLEAAILTLIWQQTRKVEVVNSNSRTVFVCPACGNTQGDAAKLRSHLNMLHNDTEALMKFLILQKSPTSLETKSTCTSTNGPASSNGSL